MSLRVTQNILFTRAARDVHFGLRGSARLQHMIATGRRVNLPSDDPAATLRILPLNAEIRNLAQFKDNIGLARDIMNISTASLEDGSLAMQRARELTVQAANGTMNASDRASIAEEIDQLLKQMVGLANTKQSSRYLFGGTNTDTPAFTLIESGGRTRVVYNGNQQSTEVEVAPGVTTELNIPGDRIFMNTNRGATIFTQSAALLPTGAQPGSGTDSGTGFGVLEISFKGLHTDTPPEITAGTGVQGALGPLSYTFTDAPATLSIDGGPALVVPTTDQRFITADGRAITLSVSDVPATLTGTFTAVGSLSTDGGKTLVDISDFTQQNVQVIDSYDGTVLNVDVTGLNRTGSEQVEFQGTFDAFEVLIALRDTLRNDLGQPEDEVSVRLTRLLGEIDNAHDGVLEGLRELGFHSSSMDLLNNRVDSLRIQSLESLSLVQDTDLTDAILEMQRRDIIFQASLQIAARVIQMSIQGFLR